MVRKASNGKVNPNIIKTEDRPGMELQFEVTEYVAPVTAKREAAPNPYTTAAQKVVEMKDTMPGKQMSITIKKADLGKHKKWVRDAVKALGFSASSTSTPIEGDDEHVRFHFRAINLIERPGARKANKEKAAAEAAAEAPAAA